MRHLVLPAKIIGVLWFVFAITILPSLQSLNQQGELLVFALNVLGAASIAFVYGHSRGKKGLTAGWIGKVFLALLVLLPLIAMSVAEYIVYYGDGGCVYCAVFVSALPRRQQAGLSGIRSRRRRVGSLKTACLHHAILRAIRPHRLNKLRQLRAAALFQQRKQIQQIGNRHHGQAVLRLHFLHRRLLARAFFHAV